LQGRVLKYDVFNIPSNMHQAAVVIQHLCFAVESVEIVNMPLFRPAVGMRSKRQQPGVDPLDGNEHKCLEIS
jgi:hypothetical protein